MIKIESVHLQAALRYFEIEGTIKNIKILTNEQEERRGKLAVRIVTEVELDSGKKLIVKFLNEREFILDVTHLQITTETIEKQSAFSEILRENGMILPPKYQKNGYYCMPFWIDGMPLDVTIEEFLGKPLEKFSPELFYQYGCILGQIHKISLEQHCKIGFSIVFQELMDGRTDFRKIFSGLPKEILPEPLIEQIAQYHDQYKKQVIAAWPNLPRSAVQGDLYSNNNVSVTEKGIGFYDFNVAADEVLLGDMLHVWFRTVYDSNNEDQIENWNLNKCWRDYQCGYFKYRRWTKEEESALPGAMMLLDMIYHGRYGAELMRQGRVSDGRRALESIIENIKLREGE